MKDQQKFKELILMLGDIFDKKVSSGTLKTYWQVLSSYTDTQFATAADAYMRVGKFFPRPADFIELIEGTSEANAHEAWATALLELRDSANAKFDAKTAKVIAALGGAEYLGQMSYRDLEFKKKDFIAIYESLDNADPTPRIESGQSESVMGNDLVKKVTDDTTRNSDDENEPDS